MLSIHYIRENEQEVKDRLSKRNPEFAQYVTDLLTIDAERRSTQQNLDNLTSEIKNTSKDIGKYMQMGNKEGAESLKVKTSEWKEQQKILQETMSAAEAKIEEILYLLPNTPAATVPNGRNADDNEIVFQNKEVDSSRKNLFPHWDLAEKFDLIDFKNGTKITGSGFPVYTGKGAKLQRALIHFFLAEGEKAGYKEFMPPLLVNEASGIGTGQLPDKEGQMYHVGIDDLYLIPTAEVPITNLFRDVILQESELPLKCMGYTPCFRREAGSYGKDVRGLNRLHQFDKVEIVQIAHPEHSYMILEEMVTHVKGLLEKLGLTYRIAKLCAGDMGFTSALTFDMEVYSLAQEKWLEVSSISNFETFQANRLKCRFKNSEGKNELVHTLNGSALALPRIVACLLENNQTENGIAIPEVLQGFMGCDMI